ncbi:hypothetical protein BH11PSE9_BH11PSE9_15850 [soil metagenome]
MANETPEQIRLLPEYIENRAHSGLIRGLGGSFEISLRPDGAKAIVIERRACEVGTDPLAAGEYAATGIYAYEREALAAVARVRAVAPNNKDAAYAHYRGPEGVVLPTMICDTTAPNLTRTLRALLDLERANGRATSKTLLEVVITLGGLRGAGAARGVSPGAGKVPGPPSNVKLPMSSAGASVVSASGYISRAEMLRRVVAIWERTPVLQRLARARKLVGPAQQKELIEILGEFERTTQVAVQRVKTGAVQAVRGEGNLASLRSRPGVLQIEEQVFTNTTTLRDEVTHELSYYYSQSERAFCGPHMSTMTFLEAAVTDGIEALQGFLGP